MNSLFEAIHIFRLNKVSVNILSTEWSTALKCSQPNLSQEKTLSSNTWTKELIFLSKHKCLITNQRPFFRSFSICL